ncbi:C-1-tetrahydrofolate synthase cytoplasmic [Taenia solium]|eukprot:TsM_000106700 transcript=TsM_000106700 gene=TsM_000106700
MGRIAFVSQRISLSACQLAYTYSGNYLRWKKCPFLVHIPCAAAACLLLLQETGPTPVGLRCLVIGRGRLVGTPVISLMLRSANATTTICHTDTRCLEEEVNRAEIIVSGVGKAHLVKGDWIRDEAIVIDCGTDASSGTSNLFPD